MLLAYVDESYCRECYYVTALVCPERQAIPLADALDGVVADAAEYGVPPRAELHGYDIFQAKGAWQTMAPMIRARIGVYARALDATAACDVRVVVRGVRSAELRERHATPRRIRTRSRSAISWSASTSWPSDRATSRSSSPTSPDRTTSGRSTAPTCAATARWAPAATAHAD